MKKYLIFLLAICIISSPINVLADGSEVHIVYPSWIEVKDTLNSLIKSGNTLTHQLYITTNNGGLINAKIQLERLDGNTWRTINTRNVAQYSKLTYDFSTSVATGYTYRVKVFIRVNQEGITSYSNRVQM